MADNVSTTDGLTIRLYGRFDVVDCAGASLKPKGAKTRALIALLASSDNFERQRTWLQSMLWSDRGAEQRSSSLRQCLAELRRVWSGYPDALITDRQSVRLDPALVRLAVQNPQARELFLEDLTIRDPAYTAWLELQRGNRIVRPTAQSASHPADHRDPQTVILTCSGRSGPDGEAIEQLTGDAVSRTLQESRMVAVRTSAPLADGSDGIRISVAVTETGNTGPSLRAVVEDLETGNRLWNGQCRVTGPVDSLPEDLEFLSFCNQIANAVVEREAWQADMLGQDPGIAAQVNKAVRYVFSIREDKLSQAVTLLQQAIAAQSKGIFHAWLAQAYTIQYVERYVPADAELREKTNECCLRALSDDPTNSNVLAAVANARTNISRNYAAGLHLAQQSVVANKANPLAWWALSNALQCTGRSQEAYRAALNAQALAQSTRWKFWTDFQVSLTAAVLGNDQVAIANGERSSAFAPNFRPPLRYLTALYALSGQHADMQRTLDQLKDCEPDVSVRRMIEDRDYPIGIMRRYGGELTSALQRSESDPG